MKKHNALKLLVSLAAPQAAGAIGSVFTFSSIPTWYAGLARPDFAPPNWVFGPVWTTLYILMGVAAFLVWKKGGEKKGTWAALGVFAFQLVLNSLWSVLFFGLQSPGWALVEIAALWLAIVWNIVAFARVSKAAGWLLVPYLLWVSFASYLNYSIWALN